MTSPQGLRKTGLSRSSPSLVTAAAFNLRDFSQSRSKLKQAPPPENLLAKAASLDKIDLIGGNGRWKQRAAEVEFDRRRVENIEQQRLQREADEAKERRQAARAEQRRRVHEEEDRRRREAEERILEDQRQKRLARQEQLAKERARREEEARERERRAPKTCQTCNGSGVCQSCRGEGHQYSVYLVSEVTKESRQEFGKSLQGCADCGGCKQGIRGELQKGSGQCRHCMGYGKIWPNIDDSPSPKAGRIFVDKNESYDRLRVAVPV